MITVKRQLRRYNGTDYDIIHLETDGSVVEVEVSGSGGTTTTDLNTALNDKQDKLAFDGTPTADSTNPVTSGGVKSYVDNIAAALQVLLDALDDRVTALEQAMPPPTQTMVLGTGLLDTATLG